MNGLGMDYDMQYQWNVVITRHIAKVYTFGDWNKLMID
jgi:hypothetical protein